MADAGAAEHAGHPLSLLTGDLARTKMREN